MASDTKSRRWLVAGLLVALGFILAAVLPRWGSEEASDQPDTEESEAPTTAESGAQGDR